VLTNSDDKAVTAEIVKSDLMLAECRRALPRVTVLAAKCGHDGVSTALQPLLIMFGAPDFGEVTDGLMSTWVGLYVQALGHLPREALDFAVSDWIANGKPFFPKPTELNARAKKQAEDVWRVAWLMRMAVEFADKHKAPAEDPEERRRGIEQARQDLAAMRAGGFVRMREMPRETQPATSRHALAESLRGSV